MFTRSARGVSVLTLVMTLTALGAQPALGRPPTRGGLSINFDDVAAPCHWDETVALRDEYAALGVHFRGPARLDGGGVLNECANFGVRGHSRPNLLGFHTDGVFADGGMARGPERIRFDSAMTHVEVKVAHGRTGEGSVLLQAYDASGALLDSAQVVLTSILTVIAVDASAIRLVRVSSNSRSWVLDDLVGS
jgi:hypothetical protein